MRTRRSNSSGSSADSAPILVGWHEYVALPDWGITKIRAKVDTGAKTSALHVENLERDGHRVRFDTFGSRRGRRHRVRVETAITRTADVRSSSGHQAVRFFTKAKLLIGPIERTIELSLVDRGHMTFPMLLGRSSLRGFVVDPTKNKVLDSL